MGNREKTGDKESLLKEYDRIRGIKPKQKYLKHHKFDFPKMFMGSGLRAEDYYIVKGINSYDELSYLKSTLVNGEEPPEPKYDKVVQQLKALEIREKKLKLELKQIKTAKAYLEGLS